MRAKIQIPEIPEEEKTPIKPILERISPLVQRQDPETKEEEEGDILQPKLEPRAPVDRVPTSTSMVRSLCSGGHPLSQTLRGFFEPRFGRSFEKVRIHTESNAAEAAKRLNARAFTYGNHILFDGDQYHPETTDGKKLLGHELAHVVQQEGSHRSLQIQRKPRVKVTEGEGFRVISPIHTRGNVAKDVEILKAYVSNFNKAIVISGNKVTVYNIGGAKPDPLISLRLKKNAAEFTFFPFYYWWAPDNRFYPLAFVNDKVEFIGKSKPATAEQKQMMERIDRMYYPQNWFDPSDFEKFQKI